MALTEITIDVKNSRMWKNPETGEQWQIITGWETFMNRHGEMKPRKWSLWNNQAVIEVGEADVMTVKGELATKTDKWIKDGVEHPVVDHSLFDYTITNHNTSRRRGGDLNGVDQDDVIKYGHTTYGTPDGTMNAGEAPF